MASASKSHDTDVSTFTVDGQSLLRRQQGSFAAGGAVGWRRLRVDVRVETWGRASIAARRFRCPGLLPLKHPEL